MRTRRSLRLALLVVASALLWIPASLTAYVGRCPTCGSVVDVDPIAYDREESGTPPRVGAIVGAIDGRASSNAAAGGKGLVGRAVERKSAAAGERGTRLEIRMDKGGVRTIEVHGDPRIYRGDRVRVFRDRVEIL